MLCRRLQLLALALLALAVLAHATPDTTWALRQRLRQRASAGVLQPTAAGHSSESDEGEGASGHVLLASQATAEVSSGFEIAPLGLTPGGLGGQALLHPRNNWLYAAVTHAARGMEALRTLQRQSVHGLAAPAVAAVPLGGNAAHGWFRLDGQFVYETEAVGASFERVLSVRGPVGPGCSDGTAVPGSVDSALAAMLEADDLNRRQNDEYEKGHIIAVSLAVALVPETQRRLINFMPQHLVSNHNGAVYNAQEHAAVALREILRPEGPLAPAAALDALCTPEVHITFTYSAAPAPVAIPNPGVGLVPAVGVPAPVGAVVAAPFYLPVFGVYHVTVPDAAVTCPALTHVPGGAALRPAAITLRQRIVEFGGIVQAAGAGHAAWAPHGPRSWSQMQGFASTALRWLDAAEAQTPPVLGHAGRTLHRAWVNTWLLTNVRLSCVDAHAPGGRHSSLSLSTFPRRVGNAVQPRPTPSLAVVPFRCVQIEAHVESLGAPAGAPAHTVWVQQVGVGAAQPLPVPGTLASLAVTLQLPITVPAAAVSYAFRSNYDGEYIVTATRAPRTVDITSVECRARAAHGAPAGVATAIPVVPANGPAYAATVWSATIPFVLWDVFNVKSTAECRLTFAHPNFPLAAVPTVRYQGQQAPFVLGVPAPTVVATGHASTVTPYLQVPAGGWFSNTAVRFRIESDADGELLVDLIRPTALQRTVATGKAVVATGKAVVVAVADGLMAGY